MSESLIEVIPFPWPLIHHRLQPTAVLIKRRHIIQFMRNSAVLVVLVMLGSVLAGCFGGDETEEVTPEVVTPDEGTAYAWDERGKAPSSDIHLYSEDGSVKFDSCDFFSDFPSPESPIAAQGVLSRPYDGVDDDGMASIIEPTDFDGKVAIFYLDDEFEEKVSFYRIDAYMTAWVLAQQRGASAIIYSEYNGYDKNWNAEEIWECDEIQWHAESGLSVVDLLTIPVVLISPSDMKKLVQTPNPFIEMGPDGFEPTGWSEPLVEEVTDVSLATLRVSSWEQQNDACTDESAGAIVTVISQDTNQDGVYQENEKDITIECRTTSPYGGEVVSISSNFHYETVPSSECSSTQKFRVDITTSFASGDSTTVEGTDYACEGVNEESFEIQLKRLICTNGQIPSELELARVSIATCISPMYEPALQNVIPQIRIESLSSEQMPICQNGGLLITVWADGDANQAWDQSETQSTQRLCHGSDGADGQDGQDGLDAYELLVNTQDASQGSCPATIGGKEVLLGRDVNENGVLDDSEIEHSYATCNGDSGADGNDGQSSVLNITSFSSPQCNGVYVRLANGHDLNNDSTLSLEETLGSRFICLPSQQTNTNATFVKETIDPNSNCRNGGVRSYIWIDENGDNVVQETNNSSEVFMETLDCAPNEPLVDCQDSDGDCISDEDDEDSENSRDELQDSDGDGVPDLEDVCPNGDDNIDTDDDGIPEYCDDDF